MHVCLCAATPPFGKEAVRLLNAKLDSYLQLADSTVKALCAYPENWKGFLFTAAQNYKYSFFDQVLIYAQRPDATACAEYGFWGKHMGRYVRRGSKGIALIDSRGDVQHLRYVFDVSDTAERTEWHRRFQRLTMCPKAKTSPVSSPESLPRWRPDGGTKTPRTRLRFSRNEGATSLLMRMRSSMPSARAWAICSVSAAGLRPTIRRTQVQARGHRFLKHRRR